MYLRITHPRVELAAIYEQLAPVYQEFNVAMRGLPEPQWFWQGINHNAGTGAVVSLWDMVVHAHVAQEALAEPRVAS